MPINKRPLFLLGEGVLLLSRIGQKFRIKTIFFCKQLKNPDILETIPELNIKKMEDRPI